jgi:YidC/Oxa1 family membrane protein insertase
MLGMKQNDPNAPEDRLRLILAIAISLGILLAYQVFYVKPHHEQLKKQAAQEQRAPAQPGAVPAASAPAPATIARDAALKESARVEIRGARVSGSLALRGGRFDDLRLLEHSADITKKEKVALLSPADSEGGYYVDSGWLSAGGTPVTDMNTVWRLAPGSAPAIESGGKPVILSWDNGQGLSIERSISLDKDFLFTIRQRVTNRGGADTSLNAYTTTARNSLPKEFSGFYVLHEGPMGFLGGKTYDPSYQDLVDGEKVSLDNTQGWLGITDKYWLVAMLPAPQDHFSASVFGSAADTRHHFQADVVNAPLTLKPGETAEQVSYLYAGAKDLRLIHRYEKKYGFNNLELSFDFGLFYIFTKPFYYLLHFLMHFFGNVGLAILVMTVIVRGAMFPVASKSFRSMAQMKVVAPLMKEIQEKYKDSDAKGKAKMQQEIFDLYKRYDVNPFSGCLPILIQIPVFFALYKVILLSVEMRHAPFWGWIPDLSKPDPTTIFNLFGLIPWQPPFTITLGAWPVIYTLTMLLQKRVSPPMPDPAQERMQAWFPYVFGVLMAQFPVGLVIYYSWSNLLGVVQQYYILKEVGGQDTSLIRGHAERRKKPKAGDAGRK